MEQRITRAKKKVGSAGIPFETPSALDRNERLGSVCAMLYLVFNQGYSAPQDAGAPPGAHCVEAIRLTRMLLRLFPGQSELMGLLALMLLQHARLSARFDATGLAIPLEEQDRSCWDAHLIGEGLALVDKGMHYGGKGSFLIQAAIAALHARAATAPETDWAQIEVLYSSLERVEPSPVVTLNRAVALTKAKDAQAGLHLADSVAQPLASYFYLHGVRGALLRQLGRNEEARTAFGKAIGLAGSAAEAAHIRRQLDELAVG
jgi:RNA polymerase sigma-70 factor (ECF subfamily)